MRERIGNRNERQRPSQNQQCTGLDLAQHALDCAHTRNFIAVNGAQHDQPGPWLQTMELMHAERVMLKGRTHRNILNVPNRGFETPRQRGVYDGYRKASSQRTPSDNINAVH